MLVEPGPETVDVPGLDFMSHANLGDIVRAALFDTGEQLRAPIVRTLLAGLNNPTRPACPRPRRAAA